jgi:hypothetical protein
MLQTVACAPIAPTSSPHRPTAPPPYLPHTISRKTPGTSSRPTPDTLAVIRANL